MNDLSTVANSSFDTEHASPSSIDNPTANQELKPTRSWLAELSLGFAKRPAKTVLANSLHQGPLRVQKPFYPEADGTCHVYILHPPGGIVAGDRVLLSAELEAGTQALLTTPAAGKMYGTKTLPETQHQLCDFHVGNDAILEWLPQETIIFNEAKAHATTKIHLEGNGKAFVWDIVRLGRIDSGERFTSGYCEQRLELWQNDQPLFIERNRLIADHPLRAAKWGLQNANTTATLCATVVMPKEKIEACIECLNSKNTANGLWGLTQKQSLFIARYLGDSISQCREGFEYLWQECRPYFSEKPAVRPRIWNT